MEILAAFNDRLSQKSTVHHIALEKENILIYIRGEKGFSIKEEDMQRRCRMVFTAVMTMSLMTATAFAEETVPGHERICDIESLREAVEDGSLDYAKINDYVSADTIDIFTEEKMMLANEKLADVNISEIDLADGYEERIIDLGDDSYIKITLTDDEEGNDSGIAIKPSASTAPSTTLWKDYGNRQFTSTYELSVLGSKYKMSICNHYTLSAAGIKVRYGEASMYINSNTNRTPAVVISKATAGTGSSVSMYATFNISSGKTVKLTNSVRCVQIDKTNERVKVTQSWNAK